MAASLLLDRCDPYGIESTVKLFGGMFDEKHMGRYIWYCTERAEARFRYMCTGGDYGFRRQNDGGLINAYHCDGGHKGPAMPLCRKHQRDLAVGPPAPGWSADKTTPYGQVGGTKSNEMCPACACPPRARSLMEDAERLQQEMARLVYAGLDVSVAFLRLQSQQDQVRAALDELHERGIAHKCPLKLVEVS